MLNQKKRAEDKIEACWRILKKINENKYNVTELSYKNVNVFINFIETFAFQGVFLQTSEILWPRKEFKEIERKITLKRKNYFSAILKLSKLDLDGIRAVRSVIVHGSTIKKPEDFLCFLKNKNSVSDFFRDLEEFTGSMVNKICKISGDSSKDIHCDSFLVIAKNIGVKGEGNFYRSLKSFLHIIYDSEAKSINQDYLEKIIFDLGVNVIPVIDYENDNIKTLSFLRNELIHSFHENETDEKKFEKIKKLTLHRSDLFKYFYSKVVHELLKDMPPDKNIEILQTDFQEKLEDLQKDIININTEFVSSEPVESFEYNFKISLFPETDKKIEDLVNEYLKYMFIVEIKAEVIEDQIDDEDEITSSLQYMKLSDCKRREIFEDFLRLKKIPGLTGAQLQCEKGKRNELKEKLKRYGIEVDNFDSAVQYFVDASKDLPQEMIKGRNKIVNVLSILRQLKIDFFLSNNIIINLYEKFLGLRQKGISNLEICESVLGEELNKSKLTESQKSSILNKICNLPDVEKIEIILGDKKVTELNTFKVIRSILAVFCGSYDRYYINFNNVKEIFNDEIFLDYLVSLNIEIKNNCKVLKDKYFVFLIIKKVIDIQYTSPYISKLIIESNDDTVIERKDFINLLNILLKNNSFIMYFKQLLNVNSKKVDMYKEFCNYIIDNKDCNIDSMNVVLKEYNHVKIILSKLSSQIELIKSHYLTEDEATKVKVFCNKVLGKDFSMENLYAVLQDDDYEAILSKLNTTIEKIEDEQMLENDIQKVKEICCEIRNMDFEVANIQDSFQENMKQLEEILPELKCKVIKFNNDKKEKIKNVEEIIQQILKQLNIITYELHRENCYEDVVKLLETSMEAGKKLSTNDDLQNILIDAKYQKARSITQLARIKSTKKEKESFDNEKLNKALEILDGIKKEEEEKSEGKNPKLLLISVAIAYVKRLLKMYDESYESYESVFQEIEKIALGGLCTGNNKFYKIENSKEYKKILTSDILWSSEAKKYLSVTDIQSSMAFNKVCKGQELAANFNPKEALDNYKEALGIYQELYNFKRKNLNKTLETKDITRSTSKILKTKFSIGNFLEKKKELVMALQYYQETLAKGIQYNYSLKKIYRDYHPLFKASKTKIVKILLRMAAVNDKLGSSNFYWSKNFKDNIEKLKEILKNSQANYEEAVKINEELKDSPYYKGEKNLKEYINSHKGKLSEIEVRIKELEKGVFKEKKSF